MARINFPTSFENRVALFRILKPKVMAMPLPNAFAYYMSENNISLAADETALNKAVAAHDAAAVHSRDTEMHLEEAKRLMKRARKDHRRCCQNLKTIFTGQERTLGNWGVTVNNKNKIVYAKRMDEHAKEMLDLIAKHNTFAPGTSPLQPLLNESGINLSANATNIASALIEYDKAATDSRSKEEKREEWKLLMKPIVRHLRDFGQIAIKLYTNNPHHAGDLGYTVDSTKQKARLRTITLQAGQEISYSNVALGGFLTMLSDGVIGIRPRGKPKAPLIPITDLKPFEIRRGFGQIFIKNLLDGQKVRFSLPFHK